MVALERTTVRLYTSQNTQLQPLYYGSPAFRPTGVEYWDIQLSATKKQRGYKIYLIHQQYIVPNLGMMTADTTVCRKWWTWKSLHKEAPRQDRGLVVCPNTVLLHIPAD